MPGQRPCEVGIVGLLWYAGASLDLSHCWVSFVSRNMEEEMTLLGIKPTPNFVYTNN